MKSRQNLYIDTSLADQLERLGGRAGASKSAIVNAALAEYLARQGSKAIDDLLKTRLDRMSREIATTHRDLNILIESFALFVRWQLTVTAPVPEADSAALATGNARFERFVAQLGRDLARDQRTLTRLGDHEGGA